MLGAYLVNARHFRADILAVCASLGIHLSLFFLFSSLEMPKPPEQRRGPVKIRIAESSSPAPTPKKELAPEVPLPSVESALPQVLPLKPRTRLERKPRKPEPQPQVEPKAEKTKSEPAPEPAGTGPQRFGIRLENTVLAEPGSGVGVPVGDSLQVSPGAPGPPRKSTQTSVAKDAAGGPAPMATLTEMPKVVADSRPDYPEEARRLGVQGKVGLELVIDEQGRVAQARVVKPLHPLLDKAALEAAWGLKFTPAKREGKPVSTRIPYTYVFILE